jgi:DNA gyrase inhibitor GyrI
MKILKIILITVVALVAISVAIFASYGGFKKIEFNVEEQGGEIMVYESITGDYSQSADAMNRIYHSLLENENIETMKGVGIYYDNPQSVDKDKLRSEIGCIVENADSATIAALSEKYPVKIIPRTNYIVTEFPLKGNASIMVGIVRVYPALNKYCAEHGFLDSPIVEIYDIPNKKIIYRKEAIK